MGSVVISEELLSWGRFPRTSQRAASLRWRDDPLPNGLGLILPRGRGRSYGDVCLNSEGTLITTALLNRFIAFDRERGILRCEAGTTLDQILGFVVPRGWFLPVVPGTRFVTVGGAIANDIHGKNHHVQGTFGRQVLRFELRRSDGERCVCAPGSHHELFGATIGGLGLTGLITWAELQLQPIETPFIRMESIQFRGLDEFLGLSRGTESSYPYTVAWLDCVASGGDFCRGIFMRGAHASAAEVGVAARGAKRTVTVPFDAPGWVLNRWTVQAFNTMYFHRQRAPRVESIVHYEPFFFPLDGVLQWNRIYGRRGFFQFQGVIPSGAIEIIKDLMTAVVDSGQASFLAVLKEFGDIPSPGWLSFPRSGITVCLDFQNRGERTVALMKRLEAMVIDAGGALYPAKDALMSADSFRTAFPRWGEFLGRVDPAMSSDFWRRVNGGVSHG